MPGLPMDQAPLAPMPLSPALMTPPPVCEMVLVGVSYVLLIISNVLSSTGFFGGDIGAISDSNPTFVTPDGLTFAVWGVIYLLEAVFVIAQFCPSEFGEELLRAPCPLMCFLPVRVVVSVAFIANAIWLPIYLSQIFWLALVVILVYLWALLAAFIPLTAMSAPLLCARPSAPFSCNRLVYAAPIAANTSWLLVATAANLFTVLGRLGWQDANGVAGSPEAAMLVVFLVTVIACALAIATNDLVWGLVAAWALAGLGRMQSQADAERFPVDSLSPALATISFGGAVVVCVCCIIGLILACVFWQPPMTQYRLP